MTIRLAYFGPPGTNTEEAAIKYSGLHGGGYQLIPFPTITGTALAIPSGAADEAILPVENSLDGAIGETLDFLIHTPEPHFIRDELVLLIEHYLLARPGVQLDAVKVIKSIPTVFAQCRGYIDRNFPNARIEAALSTAAAVEEVMKRDDAAAIGNRRAGEIYRANVLASGLQDRSPNHTRFVVIGREDHARTGDDKTSIAFAYASEDRPGQLVGSLNEFGARNINLSKIESRPSKERLGTYIFLVDLAGHRTDPPLAEALAIVEKSCSFFRVLGSYPRYRGE
jgi:prephenate dehydratase